MEHQNSSLALYLNLGKLANVIEDNRSKVAGGEEFATLSLTVSEVLLAVKANCHESTLQKYLLICLLSFPNISHKVTLILPANPNPPFFL